MKKRTLLVGHLVTHSLLYIGFLFTTDAKQAEFLREFLKNHDLRKAESFEANRYFALQELLGHIASDFTELRKTLNLSAEKV